MKIIDIDSLQYGIPFITKGWFELYKEKCLIAFSNQNHSSGVEMSVDFGNIKDISSVLWSGETNQQLIHSHADSKKTTDDAACAISLLLIREYTDYTAYKTSDASGERIDYYLKKKECDQDETLIFNNSAYLEVSGIREEKEKNTISNRLKQKTNRLKDSTISFNDDPVFVCIVEFRKPSSTMEDVSWQIP
jgi:hypothetical protein